MKDQKNKIKFKQYFMAALKLILVLSTLLFLYYNGDLKLSVFGRLAEFPWVILGVLMINFTLHLGLIGFRGWLLLKILKIPIPFFASYYYSLVFTFYTIAAPFGVGGDVARGYYLYRYYPDSCKFKIIASLILDRFFGLVSLCFLMLLVSLLNYEYMQSKLILAVWFNMILLACAFFTVGMIALLIIPQGYLKKLEGKLQGLPFGKLFNNFLESFWLLRKSPGALLIILGNSIALHGTIICLFLISSWMLFPTFPMLEQQILMLALGILIITIPITPAGIGVGHLGFAYLFSLIGIKQGADIFTLMVTQQIVFSLLCGVVYSINSRRKDS